MSQFSVHRNPNPLSCETTPYLLDIQHEPVGHLEEHGAEILAAIDFLITGV